MTSGHEERFRVLYVFIIPIGVMVSEVYKDAAVQAPHALHPHLMSQY